MKSVNKKALACLLALVMVFESMTGISVMAQTDRAADAVGAAGDSFASAVAMQPEEKYDVTLAAEGNAYYKFTPEESGSYTFHVTGGRVSLYLHDEDLDYQGGAQEIVVPDAIREIAPKGLTNVNAQKIVLPKQLVKIWEYGVSGCKNLKEINIPGNVSDIAYHAFSECTALESAVINEGTKNIGHHAFAGCSALKTLTIKEGLKQIEDHAFVNDRNLTEATIPKSVVSIGEKAFGYYSSFYTGNAVVKNNPLLTMRCYPDSKAHQYAVENALSVTLLDENGQEIKKPSQNTGDNGNAPVKTGELHTVKYYAYEIISANTVAFAGLAKKDSKSVKIPDKVTIEGKEFKVTEVKDQAFQKTDIKSVTMPSGIQSIGTKAFYSCKKLKKITIPASVSEIGSQAFGNCKKLKNITVKTTMLTKKSIGKKAFKGISEKAAIKVPKQKLKAYQKLFKSKGAGTKVKFKK